MIPGDCLHGFILKERRALPETGGDGLYFEHIKNGARLLVLANEDENKTFGVGFRTPSADSTGVAHILEHSVLNGSKKYRTKEPFMDMAKSSLATFLNAMTFSDKTIYPVASRNDKDFENLMDVYLDAVFNPSIYTTKEVFLQEGWHYHLENKDDELSYRGVVYNEMRGALSGADEQVADAVLAALYPDTVYGCESGGNPYEIPNLSYEAFLDFHRRLYHPSNSYLFLYGKVDLDTALARINEGYLDHYERAEIDSALSLQKPFAAAKEVEVTYSVSADDETAEKDHLVYAVVFGTRTTLRDLFLADLFRDALIDSQAAPLRKALLAKGIGADIDSFGSDGVQIPFGVVAKDTTAERREEFVAVVEETLSDLVEQGLPQELLLASLNKIEFSLREASGYATRGIVHYINAFESWLYDGSPFATLAYNEPLAELRADIESGRLAEELKERVLDNPHKLILTARPEAGKNDRRDAQVAKELADFKASLSDDELEQLVAETQLLLKRQNSEDSPEARATLPRLTLDDIDPEVVPVPRESRDIGGAQVLLHDLFTAGIVYIDLLFNTDHIGHEELSDYALLTALIGAMDTTERSYSDLVTEEYLRTGGISLHPSLFADYLDRQRFYPRLSLSTRMLASEAPEGFFNLAQELLLATDFSNRNRLHEIIQMMRSRMEMGIFQQGHTITAARAKSYLSAAAKYQEALSGYDFLFYLQDLDKRFDEVSDDLVKRLEALYRRLIKRQDLLIGLTGEGKDLENCLPALEAFLQSLPTTERTAKDFLPEPSLLNEGILSAAGVQYVTQAANLEDYGVTYSGELEVLSNLLSYEYLYNEIRAKGGAYGQGIKFTKSGLMTIYSYRDPNLEATFDVYAGMADWLENLSYDEDRLTATIIGTMNRFNPAMTERSKGALDLRLALTGQTYADIESTQQEALATTAEALRGYADALRQAIGRNVRCVLGNSSRIKAAEDRFDRLVRLDSGQ